MKKRRKWLEMEMINSADLVLQKHPFHLASIHQIQMNNKPSLDLDLCTLHTALQL